MCGIAGIVGFRGADVDDSALNRTRDALRHRGPDDSGVWVDADARVSVGMAATRLAVLDPSPAARQPMHRQDRFTVVFNGLIYNYRELRDELVADGHCVSSGGDTEVVLAACARWGVEALPRLNGMFALAFFDRRTRRGFVARDRFGIKPLVWCHHGDRLYFASEMRALKQLGDWPRGVSAQALEEFIRFGFVGHPNTIYENVRRMSPGSFLPFDEHGPGPVVRYHRLKMRDIGDAATDGVEAGRLVRRALFESVARRRVADVPVGAFLSGGLDSSIVVAHLAEVTPGSLPTFSIGWADQGAYDETRYARRVAGQFGTAHTALRCTYDDVVKRLPDMLDHLGEPFFDSSILPTAIVSELAGREVTVCLSGDGGDELFGGYWRYIAHRACDRFERSPRLMQAALKSIAQRMHSSKSTPLANKVRQFRKMLRGLGRDIFDRHRAWSSILSSDGGDILRGRTACDDAHIWRRFDEETREFESTGPLGRTMVWDVGHGLVDDMLHKVDLASMRHSLEVRVPFLDPEVVEIGLSIPAAMKFDGLGGKAVLRHAYRDILPDEVLERPKMGFEVPIGEFLRDRLRDLFMATVTRARIESFGIIDFGSVMRVYEEHCARRAEHADLLFALLSLCRWKP